MKVISSLPLCCLPHSIGPFIGDTFRSRLGFLAQCRPHTQVLPLPVDLARLWGLWDGHRATYADGGSTIHISPILLLVLSATTVLQSLLRAACGSATCVVGGTGTFRMTTQSANTACMLWLAACGWHCPSFRSMSAHALCTGNGLSTIAGQQLVQQAQRTTPDGT